MRQVRSKDGTAIAYDQIGTGQPVILVDGAFCNRSFGPMPKLAPLLAPHFTVFAYDRRGRGDSGDTKPYAVEREVEDIAALINNASGSPGAAHPVDSRRSPRRRGQILPDEGDGHACHVLLHHAVHAKVAKDGV